jgi:hypothetical protein
MAFKRFDGFAGSIPQRFADKSIPVCPICGTSSPRWLINMQMKFLANRYLFKCSNCKAILSATVIDVTRLDKLPIPTFKVVKAMSNKNNKIMVKIDSVGDIKTKSNYKDKVFSLDKLNEIALSEKSL